MISLPSEILTFQLLNFGTSEPPLVVGHGDLLIASVKITSYN